MESPWTTTDTVRRVTNRGDARTVELERVFAAPPSAVWAAITDPTELATWFDRLEGDLVTGGRYRLATSGTEGTVQCCEAPRALRVSWEYGGGSSDVEIDLSPVEGGTELALLHEVSADEHWRRFGPAATGVGWEGSLVALGLHLAHDDRARPEAVAAFEATDEGRAFVTRAAEAWGEAHAASGENPETARAAAARTAAFYRGEA